MICPSILTFMGLLFVPMILGWDSLNECNDEEFQADYANNCTYYYQCSNGRWYHSTCPKGLQFNEKENVCDWPRNVKCEGAPIGSTHRPSTYQTMSAPTTRPSTTRNQNRQTVSSYYHPKGSESDYKVVCYFTNWAWYRRGIAKYQPEDIDPDLCTHIIYAFAVLDASTLLIKPHDSWADIDNDFYGKVTELKNNGKKVLLAIGGWNDSAGDKYSKLVNNATARAKFTDHVVDFLQKHKFDGLDLDWEYPVCWQVECNKGPTSDKQGFSSWIKELRQAFEPYSWLLTAAISPSERVITKAYELEVLSRELDFINVMNYDYHGNWDSKTGHIAPLYNYEGSTSGFNVNYTITYLIENGVEPSKIIVGMPLYGQAFRLSNTSNTGLNSPAHEWNKANSGQFTKQQGILAFYEICNEGFTVAKDEQNRMGPYAYKGDQWVSYDDGEIISLKMQYVVEKGLGGAMVWALDLDDFNGECGCGSYPLLTAINDGLNGKGSQNCIT